jgi:hypothetical protein
VSAALWWTEADDAELDVLLDAFIGIYYRHRDRCDECGVGATDVH